MNTREKDEEWLLGMRKYFQVHNWSSEMKSWLSIYNLNRKAARWWIDLKNTKKDEVKESDGIIFPEYFTKSTCLKYSLTEK